MAPPHAEMFVVTRKWRARCAFHHTCSWSAPSQREAPPEPTLQGRADIQTEARGGGSEEPGGGRKWDGDAAEGGRTESERGGEREAAERSGGVQALLGVPENTTAGWRSRAGREETESVCEGAFEA